MYFTSHDIQARRARLAAKWNAILKNDEAVLVHSGHPLQKPGGLDQTYPFLPHPAYYWLTGRRREGEVLLYNPAAGWIEFQTPFTKEQAVWEGEKNDLLVQVPGRDASELTAYVQQEKFTAAYDLGQTSNYKAEGKAFELNTAMDVVRRVKDAAEVAMIRGIADIANAGYRAIVETLRPGITEKELHIAYESAIYRAGAQTVPYESIVGSGPNAAILHALPTQRVIGEGELVLVDAGADVLDYCVDITRTYASSPSVNDRQKALYDLVLKVQLACIDMCRPGNWWRDVHNTAAHMFTEGLKELGILKGELSTLLEKEVVALFFPHGLGHLVGLRVRDVGHAENLSPKTYFGARLRVDIQLEAGHLITVEPGLYFIDALLNDPEKHTAFKEDVDWNELAHWKGLGGVRIEDNLLITEGGPDNLTSVVDKAAGLVS
ncbi:MAG: aminopeptidase P family protein [Sphingobacteriales bacterium]|nr:MAG: aminopeptidase P family protein [Sphingobacteriales bacterium]